MLPLFFTSSAGSLERTHNNIGTPMREDIPDRLTQRDCLVVPAGRLRGGYRRRCRLIFYILIG